MRRFFIFAILFFSLFFATSVYAAGWSLLGPSTSGNYSSYSYGMIPSSNVSVYSNGNQGYYVQNSSSSGFPRINIYTRPYNGYYDNGGHCCGHGHHGHYRPMQYYGQRIINY